MSQVAHYCQKCLAANPLGQDFCTRCGTRLMIVVEPPAARYEMAEAGASSEEHLLERISALENRLARLTERLERGLDLLLRQAQNSYFDRALVKALISLLTEDGIVESPRLEKLWNERCQKEAEEQKESARRESLRTKILALYHGPQRGHFEQFVNEGFLLIEDQQIGRGIKSLQRAAELSANNAPLLTFVGEHFFRVGKTQFAQSYLARAYDSAPNDIRVSLLLGLACADEGDRERAKELLNSAMQRGASSFAAHYGLGRLFIAEENWRKALREFKRALVSKPSPEAHYALGCLYYQLARDTLAARHLRKATALDAAYGEAFYVLGLIYRRMGHTKLAQESFEKARVGEIGGLTKRTRKKGQNLFDLPEEALPDLRVLMTAGDERLTRALRQDALKTFTLADADHN
ncbi:MAG TPA: tetratricopeptide repeat protein [Pyrinomonadaceae bacterium]|nr:tetratricopeptide repeat protein [Pyrinomonadaceae bacterium]